MYDETYGEVCGENFNAVSPQTFVVFLGVVRIGQSFHHMRGGMFQTDDSPSKGGRGNVSRNPTTTTTTIRTHGNQCNTPENNTRGSKTIKDESLECYLHFCIKDLLVASPAIVPGEWQLVLASHSRMLRMWPRALLDSAPLQSYHYMMRP